MKYEGIIRIVREMEGSKSEGDYAYLEVDEEHSYRLYRHGHMAADVEYIRPYADTRVTVEGEEEEYNNMCITAINDKEV